MNKIRISAVLIIFGGLLLAACQDQSSIVLPEVPNSGLFITAGGELKSVETDAIAPPRIRRVWRYTISFMAPDGSAVQPGMPVLRFETQELQTRLLDKKGQLANKTSELEAAQVKQVEILEENQLNSEELIMNADKAKRKADLPKSVLAGNIYQENQLNNDLAQMELASNAKSHQLIRQQLKTEEEILITEVQKLQTEVDELQIAIESMTLKASRSGIVIHNVDWQGNKYNVGDTAWGGRRVMEVADLNGIIAKLEIPERELAQVREGQEVRFKLDSNPDKQFTGVVQSLANVVRLRSKSQPAKVVDAIVRVSEFDAEIMRPGMRISAEILTTQKEKS